MKVVAIFGGSGGLGGHVVRRLAADHAVLIGYRNNAGKATALAERLKS